VSVARASFAVAAVLLALGEPAAGRVAPPPPPTVTVTAAPEAFSPNGDGVRDSVRATIQVDQPVTLTIDLVGESGEVVYSDAPGISVQPGSLTFRWNGRTGASMKGRLAPDGRYTLKVVAVAPADVGGARGQAETGVLLDTHRPVLRWASHGVSPSVLGTRQLTLRFRVYDVSQRLELKLGLSDENGRAVPTGARQSIAPGRVELRWPRSHGARLAPSAYRLSLSATDEAGNASVSTAKRFLVTHAVRARVVARYAKVGRRIALTFDDCNSGTAWASILRTLARTKLHATFFCPGQQVLAHAEVARRTVLAGNAIGSHGWDHANFSLLSFGSALTRLDNDRGVWWKLARVAPTPYFRPPYGAYTASTMAAAGRAGYRAVVLWDVDPQDWRRPGSAVIERRILAHVRPGSIVLMHVLPQTAAMLPALVRALEARRFQPATLPELDRIGVPGPGGWPPHNSSTSGS
jgi:peptidoglycan/xylan/chitin deacetylase (PgdA/CDA1 family)